MKKLKQLQSYNMLVINTNAEVMFYKTILARKTTKDVANVMSVLKGIS